MRALKTIKITKNSYEYIIVKVRRPRSLPKPNYMGIKNYALRSCTKTDFPYPSVDDQFKLL